MKSDTQQNNRPKYIRQTTCATLAALVAIVAIYGATGKAHPGNAARNELATAQQAAERTAPICRLLAGDQHDLRQVTEVFFRVDRQGVKHRIWVVDCFAGHHQQIVHTVWDAETGNLIAAAHGPRRGVRGSTAGIPANGAARAAWSWLEALGVGRIAPTWKVAQAPRENGISWTVVLDSSRYSATVIFDRHTQDLVFLSVKELPTRQAS